MVTEKGKGGQGEGGKMLLLEGLKESWLPVPALGTVWLTLETSSFDIPVTDLNYSFRKSFPDI